MNVRSPNGPLNRKTIAGITSSIETCVLFYDWASQIGDRLTWQHIAARYECSRATAYRWLRAYRDVAARLNARRPS